MISPCNSHMKFPCKESVLGSQVRIRGLSEVSSLRGCVDAPGYPDDKLRTAFYGEYQLSQLVLVVQSPVRNFVRIEIYVAVL